MQNLEKLAELAQALPEEKRAAAVTLVQRMGEVIEGFGDKPLEWRPGTLRHVQGTSDRTRLPKGTGIGDFVLGENKLDQPFSLVALRMYTTRQYWDPNPDNQKTICSSPDGVVGYQYGECRSCPYSKFDTENNKPQCNKTMTMLCISRDLSEVFTINFAKSNYMNGVDWQSLMKKAGVAPHKRVYAISSQTSTKAKNVELIKAEPVAADKLSDAELEFLNELVRLSGEDRKVALVKFHEYAKTKAANGPALDAPPGADVQLIEDSSNGVETVTAVETTEKPASKAPKYKM